MGDNLRHAQYGIRGDQIDSPNSIVPGLPGDLRVFSPQQYDPSAGSTGGIADDTLAVLWAYEQAVKYRGMLYLGHYYYRMTQKLPRTTTPVAIVGAVPLRCGFIMDPQLEGDLFSASDTWFVAADVDQSTTSVDTSSQLLGVYLANFAIYASRTTTKTQNGIVFYNRNDNFRIYNVDVSCVKGYGIALSGPSTLSPAKSWAREFHVHNCQTRWCGDAATGRAAWVVDSDNWQVGDDSVNLAKMTGIKSVFSDGMAFSMDARTAATAQMNAIELDLIVEGGQNLSASVPAVLLKGGIKSSNIKLTFGSLQRGTDIYCLKIDQNAIGQKLDESILDLHFGSVDYGVNVVVAKNVKCFLRAANSSVLDIKIQALTGYFEVDVIGGSARVKQPIVDIAVGARSLCAIRHPAKVVTTAVLATIPATTYVNHTLIVTDAASGQKLKYSDGSTWVTVT